MIPGRQRKELQTKLQKIQDWPGQSNCRGGMRGVRWADVMPVGGGGGDHRDFSGWTGFKVLPCFVRVESGRLEIWISGLRKGSVNRNLGWGTNRRETEENGRQARRTELVPVCLIPCKDAVQETVGNPVTLRLL